MYINIPLRHPLVIDRDLCQISFLSMEKYTIEHATPAAIMAAGRSVTIFSAKIISIRDKDNAPHLVNPEIVLKRSKSANFDIWRIMYPYTKKPETENRINDNVTLP